MIAVMVIVTLALGSFAALLVWKTYVLTRQGVVDSLQTLARGTTHHLTAALAFGNAVTAKEILAVMGFEEEVIQSQLFTREGSLFAEYLHPGSRKHMEKADIVALIRKTRAEDSQERSVVEIHDDILVLVQPVVYNTKVLGYLVAVRALDSLYKLIWSMFVTVIVGSSLTLALTYFAATYLSRALTWPISDLEQVMVGVSKKGDYTMRVMTRSQDEVGSLIREFNGMLNQIDRRDRDLDQAINELKSARDTAEMASRVKSQFLMNMSHELRTPLNAIIGYSEMLSDDARKNQHADYLEDLERINGAGQHLLSLINDILDLSRVESGKMQFMYEPTDIQEIVDSIAAAMKPQAKKNGNQLVVRYNLTSRYLTVDALRFKQVLVNLIGNACKFCKDGEVSVGIRSVTRDGRNSLEVAVKDTGAGIPTEKLSGLFEVFTQVDGSYTRKYEGVGLGLALCRHLCRSMGGDIEVESIVHVGSVFTFWLPCDHRAWGDDGVKPLMMPQEDGVGV